MGPAILNLDVAESGDMCVRETSLVHVSKNGPDILTVDRYNTKETTASATKEPFERGCVFGNETYSVKLKVFIQSYFKNWPVLNTRRKVAI